MVDDVPNSKCPFRKIVSEDAVGRYAHVLQESEFGYAPHFILVLKLGFGKRSDIASFWEGFLTESPAP
jgi:hypothetical protein